MLGLLFEVRLGASDSVRLSKLQWYGNFHSSYWFEGRESTAVARQLAIRQEVLFNKTLKDCLNSRKRPCRVGGILCPLAPHTAFIPLSANSTCKPYRIGAVDRGRSADTPTRVLSIVSV